MFTCGYCGEKFETLSERCKCEQKCGKKQEIETLRKKQEELTRIKKDRDDEITNAVKCLTKQIDSYHADYHELCSIEHQSKYESTSNYIKMISLLHNLGIC